MAEKEQPTYYSILPASVRYNKNLKPNEKILYSEITAMINEEGSCYTSNDYFANLYGVSKAIVSKWLQGLEIQGLIRIESVDVYNLLTRKELNGKGLGRRKCEWCGINTAVLHKHHFPIPKKLGGLEFVNICPNCHHEFHFFDFKIVVLNNLHLEIYKEI